MPGLLLTCEQGWGGCDAEFLVPPLGPSAVLSGHRARWESGNSGHVAACVVQDTTAREG